MFINKIEAFFKKKSFASLAEISHHFDKSPQTMKLFLKPFIKNNHLKLMQSGCTKGCSSCAPEKLEIYQWVTKNDQYHVLKLIE